jgi:uncharacterized membrane protein affecting hemolysin expression
MANSLPSFLVKQVDTQVTMLLRKIDPGEVDEKGRKSLDALKQALIDARIYSRDYELSETRDEQVDNAKKANKYLDLVRQYILRASEFNIFSAIDVAYLTAQVEQAKADLK